SAADAAHLQPGDLIAQVDGDPVKTPADLQRFAEDPAAPHVCRVLRGRAYTDVTFTPVEAPKHAPISTPVGLTVGPGANDRQVMVKEVASASAAQRAGILEGDVLQSIGNKPVSDYAAAAALLSQLGQQSTVLMLERDGKELEVLIAP
ncbi:MAG TPA: PDZ domain-containing protein, partial [Capsulimonadaceae bacterium]|nr:PDZ domain-containing protein [Capsulimonadaceae bacterium]